MILIQSFIVSPLLMLYSQVASEPREVTRLYQLVSTTIPSSSCFIVTYFLLLLLVVPAYASNSY